MEGSMMLTHMVSIICRDEAAVYLLWDEADAGDSGKKRLCDSLGLGFNSMRDMKQLANQYDASLRAAGYVPSKDADRNIKSWSIIRACAVAALAPSQLVRLQRPTTKYDQTVEGAVEKDGEARELKFFIRVNVEETRQQARATGSKDEERVFVHPSSNNFAVGNYYCPWLVYHSMFRTTKPFLRDVSECSAYSLLLFAGELEVLATEGTVIIDGWVKLDARARIGSLVGGLRQRLDSLLARKIEDPSFELASTIEMRLIVKLLVTDGHG
jgi:ATP-dependent RNA helicase DHX57